MIRRSLLIFAAAVALGLAFTIGYALTGLAGPAGTIEEARQAQQNGHPAEAIRILDLAERSPGLASQPKLRAELFEIRYSAHMEMHNPRLALRDLESLLALGVEASVDHRLHQIWLLCMVDRGDEALTAARGFLDRWPDQPRGLELAGEAAQRVYWRELGEIGAAVRRDLAGAEEEAGMRALLHFLYRPAGDPSQEAGRQKLAELYASRAARQQAWHQLEPRLEPLRARVQEALGWFLRSLEAGGEPVAAWRSLSYAMQQAERVDDEVALSEIYLLRFDHRHATEAAAAAAGAHLQDGLWDAAVDVGRRFLPAGSAIQRFHAGRIDQRIVELRLFEATANWRRGDVAALAAHSQELHELAGQGLPVNLAGHWTTAVMLLLQEQPGPAEEHLGIVSRMLANAPTTRGIDLFSLATGKYLELLLARSAPEVEVLGALEAWSRRVGRESATAPVLARIRYHLGQGNGSAALTTAGEAMRLIPQDESLLRLLAHAAQACYQPSGQDGDGLLAQALRRMVAVPEVPHPVCLLLVAEAALAAGQPVIALECARKSMEKYSWSRWPRLLEAKALLQGGQAAAAQTQIEKTLAQYPLDADALRLWLEASDRTGAPVGPMLFDLTRGIDPHPRVVQELLLGSLEAGDRAAAAAFGARSETLLPLSSSVLALRAWSLALAGKPEASEEIWGAALTLAGAEAGDVERALLCEAAGARLLALADDLPDEELEDEAIAHLPGPGPIGARAHAALLRTALALEEKERPRAALAWLQEALALAEGRLRNGAQFLRGGRLALQLGRLGTAEELLTAAVSFPDGVAAAEPLALLFAARGLMDEAAAARALADDPRDPVLALRLRAPAEATRLARSALVRDPGDLAASCTLALLGADDAAAWTRGLRALDGPGRDDALAVLGSLPEPALCAASLPAARRLADAQPGSLAIGLLLARALRAAEEPEASTKVHLDLFEQGARDAILFVESVRGCKQDRCAMPAAMWPALQELARDARVPLPTDVQAYVTKANAAELAARGGFEQAQRLLVDLWLRDPVAAGVRPFEAAQLARQPSWGNDGLTLMERLLPSLAGNERVRCLGSLFAAADDLAAAGDRQAAETGRRIALRQIETEGPWAPAVWFLLRDDERALRANPRAEVTDGRKLERWVRGLLGPGVGAEPPAWAARCLEQFAERAGAEAAATACDAVLRVRPTALPIWGVRAELLARAHRPRQGLDGLRRILALADSDELALALVVLAARHRDLQPGDRDALASVAPALRDSPAGRFAGGLVALRSGQGDEAEQLLAGVPELPDGAHLYYRALANLIRRADGAPATARELFLRLESGYPSSSLARYAGSFARQLSFSP